MPFRPERVVHQRDTYGVVAKAGQRADTHLYCLHRGEDTLVRPADQELRPGLDFDGRMKAGRPEKWSADRNPADWLIDD
jgi:hypothetical protein